MESLVYWNELAGRREFTTPPRKAEIESLLPKNAEILDVGCGYGRLLQVLWDAGYQNLHGADFSPQMITTASEKLSLEIDLQVAPATALPFANDSMDAVLHYGVLTCLSNANEDAESLRECLRVLKPGGFLFLNEFLLNEDLTRYTLQQDSLGQYGTFLVENLTTLKHTSPERLRALLSGWDLLRFEPLPFRTMTGKVGQGVEVTARKRAQS